MNSLHIALLLIKRVLNRKRSVFGYLIMPALLISLAIGIMSEDNESKVRLETVNLDQGSLGTIFLEEWEHNPQFVLHASGSVPDAKERVNSQAADLFVVVPPAFTDNVLSGAPAGLEINQKDYNGALCLAEPAARSMAGQLAAAVKELQSTGVGGPQELPQRLSAMYKDKWDHSPVFNEAQASGGPAAHHIHGTSGLVHPEPGFLRHVRCDGRPEKPDAATHLRFSGQRSADCRRTSPGMLSAWYGADYLCAYRPPAFDEGCGGDRLLQPLAGDGMLPGCSPGRYIRRFRLRKEPGEQRSPQYAGHYAHLHAGRLLLAFGRDAGIHAEAW
jgi:hypothetical protein